MESTVHDVLQKDPVNLKQHDLQKDVSEIRRIKLEHVSKQKLPKCSPIPFVQAAMNEYNQKDILFKMRRESKSYNKNLTHKDLYDALVKSLLVDEDDMDRGVVESSTQKKRRHDNEGKTPPKTSKMDKSMTAEESIKEPVHEVAIDVVEHILDDVVNDAHQPQDDVDPMKDNSSWFKQPPRPKTPDPEWNKDPNIDDGPEQTWLNDLEKAAKDSAECDDLMGSTIDFSNFVKHRLKKDKITKADLEGPVFKLLKGTCKSIIELEYHLEQRYLAFSDLMD
ncbi:hypothetical protein Tco_0945720 [Tanacetum coccineum]